MTPAATPSPSGAASGSSVYPPTPTPSPPASSAAAGGLGGGGDVGQQLGTIITGGLAAIVLLAVVGFAAIWRDRRRREEGELTVAAVGPVGPVAQTVARPRREARPQADWERDYGLDDEPIGTIEYEPPAEEPS